MISAAFLEEKRPLPFFDFFLFSGLAFIKRTEGHIHSTRLTITNFLSFKIRRSTNRTYVVQNRRSPDYKVL